MKISIRPWEQAFVIASLLLFSQGFYSLVLGTSIGGDEGDTESALLRFAFILIYLITFALLGFRLPRTIAYLKTNLWLLFLIGLTILSISWSALPIGTLKEAISLVGSSGFALYFASRFNFEEQLKILGWSFGIALFFSFIFALVIPAYGIMPSGAWRGIYPHKNG
ncbi:MAG: O-antigen ligase family protein, partial [Waterburya sp.]